MDKRFLEDCLGRGMSLETIGEQVGKHPSTVSYWLKKHGLSACGAARHAQRGAISASELCELTERNATLVEMANHFERSVSTVRYWLSRYGIETSVSRGPRRRSTCGGKTAVFECRRHGATEFILEGRGHYRCKKCRSSAVTKRRRVIKQRLVAEAGGSLRPLRVSPVAWGAAVPSPRSQSQGVQSQLQRALTFLGPKPRRGAQVRFALRELPCRDRGWVRYSAGGFPSSSKRSR
jgi:transposase